MLISLSLCFRLQAAAKYANVIRLFASSADHHINETLGKQQPLAHRWQQNRSHLPSFLRSDPIWVR